MIEVQSKSVWETKPWVAPLIPGPGTIIIEMFHGDAWQNFDESAVLEPGKELRSRSDWRILETPYFNILFRV